jgi:hypothetical protein
VEQNKDTIPLTLSTVNPSLIIGPILQDFSNNSAVNASSDVILQIVKSLKEQKPVAVYGFGFVDARDCCYTSYPCR